MVKRGARGLAGSWVVWLILGSACARVGEDPMRRVASRGQQSADGQELGQETSPRILLHILSHLRDLTGYQVGAAETVVVMPGKQGDDPYQLVPAAAGIYDIVMAAVDLQDPKRPLGRRLSGVELKANRDTYIKDIELIGLIELCGQVGLLDGSPAGDSTVSIPGTKFTTRVAADGTYCLKNIPVGWHDLQVQRNGYHVGLIEKTPYLTNARVSPLVLIADTLPMPVGMHYWGPELAAAGDRNVTLHLARPVGTGYFRWGFDADVSAEPWLIFQSSFAISLPATAKSIYLQFSVDKRQSSPIYTVAIPGA